MENNNNSPNSNSQDDEIKRPKQQEAPSNLPSFVVGIGASAGGLEALEVMFENMPLKTGLSFILIQHLSPDYKSMMDELLARKTRIPITVAENDMQVEADHIYLLPPNQEMIISNYHLLLSERDKTDMVSLPINTFFRSLADSHEHKAIAIVLSGTGSDGTKGILAVHDAGGFVLAQKPESCKFDAMPQNAIDTKKVDMVAIPEAIPEALVRYSKRTTRVEQQIDLGGLDAEENRFAEIILILNNRFGLDFSQYKPSTITRRLERRLAIQKAESLQDYVNIILSNSEELESLYFDLLIGVTQFFRDEESFKDLERTIPNLLDTFADENEIRIWVAGCATGQEAYSISILIHEAMSLREKRIPYKVFATDIHRNSITTAAQGVYSESDVSSIPREFLDKYFRQEGDKFVVAPEIRKSIVFAQHNILKDPPFTRTHMVCCRNLLIYLNQAAQTRVISLLSFSLRNHGLLFMGPSESLGRFGNDFKTVSQTSKLFKKTREANRRPDIGYTFGRVPKPAQPASEGPASPKSKKALEVLLQKYVPASILVDAGGDLLHVFGDARKFLSMDVGAASLNIRAMVDSPAKTTLTQLMQHVRKTLKAVQARDVQGFFGYESVDVEIQPLSQSASDLEYFLVSFIDRTEANGREREKPQAIDSRREGDSASQSRVSELEEELQYTKESLQTTVEELETSNEELQASNEELMASNEELQSTNEELQSVNEELYTVNAEFQSKEHARAELEKDEKTLLEATDVGILFLDRNLKVRKYSPAAARFFHLIEGDIGRPYAALAHARSEELASAIDRAHRENETIELEIVSPESSAFLFKVGPYDPNSTNEEGHEELNRGVVLSFADISNIYDLRKNLKTSEVRYGHILDAVANGYFEWTPSTDSLFLPQKFLQFLGYPADQSLTWKEIITDGYEDFQKVLANSTEHSDPFQVALAVCDVEDKKHWMLCRGERLDGKVYGIMTSISELKQKENELWNRSEELERSNRLLEKFAYIVSHDLKAPIRHIRTYVEFLDQAIQKNEIGEARSEMGHLKSSSDHLDGIIDDLITFCRVSSEKNKHETVSLNDLVDDVTRVLTPDITDKKVAIRAATLPKITGDKAMLSHLFQNLLANACKYNDKEKPEVRIESSETEDAVIVSVHDNGIGFESSYAEHIFEPFKRLVTQDKYPGTGVGLAICKTVVEQHGGSIEAKGEIGKGASFTVKLPKQGGPL